MSAAMRIAALWLLALLAFGASAASVDVPFLTGRVVDNAEVLSPGARTRVTTLLKAHEDATGDQIAVLTVRTLGAVSIEEFADVVFESWKLGQKGRDNGVLLIIAPPERRMRIEVGYGLEGQLTDLHANRIIRDVMAPRFKSGDFDGGVEAAARAIIAQLRGETAEPPAGSDAPAERGDSAPVLSGFQGPDLSIAERILFGAFIFGIIGLFTVIGVLTPGIGWFMYLFLIPFWAMFPMVIVGVHGALVLLITYVVGFPVAKLLVSRSAWYEQAKKDLKTKGQATVGGFVLGGAGGSWSSGSGSRSSSWSSSSSGGFSGGGGRSGGGGSSGSW